MRSEAYKITGFTAVAAALGFLLRWLQGMRIIDPETGLADSGAGISVIVVLMLLAVAAALGVMAWRLARFDAPLEPEGALSGEAFLITAAYMLPAALLFISGFVQLLTANDVHFPESQVAIRRICAVGTLVGAASAALLAVHHGRADKAGLRRLASGGLVLFAGLWLITVYKAAASDPVIWRFAVEVLAVCAALMAFYYIAGYFFGVAAPRMAVFFCYLGAFLCVVSAVDEHTLAETILFIAVALLLFSWGYMLVWNLKPAGALTGPGTDPGAEE